MARTRFVVEDSFAAIFADLRRASQDMMVVVREELGITIGEIIDKTPVLTGQAASGWIPAAKALKAKHKDISPKTSVPKSLRYQKDFKNGVPDRRSMGERMGRYEESVPFAVLKRAVKRGSIPDRVIFIATNLVFHNSFIEYGVSYTRWVHKAGGSTKSVGRFQHTKDAGALSGEVGGYQYARKPAYIVRDAVRRMKMRLGPVLGKAVKANIGRPKRYQKVEIA